MRGKTASFLLHRNTPEAGRDDYGRKVVEPDAGVPARGSISPPSAVQRTGAPVTGTECDAVAILPTYTPVDWEEPGLWVEVTEARHPGVETGSYSITRRSGGRRVIRLELRRMKRQDGTSGRP